MPPSTAGAGGSSSLEEPSSFGPPGSPVTRYGHLRASGNRIVGHDGRPAQLKGMSLYWSDADEGARYFNAETVAWLATDWNVSIVRAAIGIREGFPGYLEQPEEQFALLERVIEGALARGVYVLVDWHDHHADRHVEQASEFFGKVADKYGSKPNVLYEVWNEPRGEGEGKAGWAEIKPYAQAISAVLRQRGAKGLMVVGTPYWDQRPDEVIGDEVQDENVAYSLHFYAGNSHHYFDNVGGGEIGKRAQAALAAGLPLFVTEFGTTSHDNTTFNEVETRKWLSFLDQNAISYCNWSITAVEEGSAAVRPSASPSGDWSEGDLSESGRLIRSLIRGM